MMKETIFPIPTAVPLAAATSGQRIPIIHGIPTPAVTRWWNLFTIRVLDAWQERRVRTRGTTIYPVSVIGQQPP